jgi:indoleacetamide hydrolase
VWAGGIASELWTVSHDGLMPLTVDKFDQVGPLARSVADLLLFDSAVTGERGQVSEMPLEGVRIGAPPEYWSGLDPEVERVGSEALRNCAKLALHLCGPSFPKLPNQPWELR